jgi:putative Mg2+ transporter-C (MgtC) family protein
LYFSHNSLLKSISDANKMDITEFVIRLLAASGAGMIIGLERQLQHKTAGLRTHTLVAAGSAIFVLISIQMTGGGQGDATRIIGQVVTGIGFLGAGVIMHQGVNVLGLTTAATIWCSSAIGCLAAAGYYVQSAISVGLVVFVNFLLFRVDEFIVRKSGHSGNSA